ncbi:hypothetical protein LX36DRAFT_192323 [Colletotrichum falcatum]|nr:hypothetical protein LX36DRAFT_192323 [Colletotrichum falcatum]
MMLFLPSAVSVPVSQSTGDQSRTDDGGERWVALRRGPAGQLLRRGELRTADCGLWTVVCWGKGREKGRLTNPPLCPTPGCPGNAGPVRPCLPSRQGFLLLLLLLLFLYFRFPSLMRWLWRLV